MRRPAGALRGARRLGGWPARLRERPGRWRPSPRERLGGLLLAGALLLTGCSDPVATASREQAPASIATGVFAPCPAASGEAPGDGGLPAVSLGCLDGSGTRVAIARPTGAPRVITLWASWCRPCATELPAFAALSSAGVEVLGVVTEDRLASARSLADETGVEFPQLFDPTGELRRALGRASLPVTLFVEADGRLAYLYGGEALDIERLRALAGEHLGIEVAG